MPSVSHVRRLEIRDTPGGPLSLLDVAIDTGRPHQIRAHLAAAGWPLLGDPLYLPGGAIRAEALPGEIGYHLHARRLALIHPATGAPLEILSMPPPPLEILSMPPPPPVLTGAAEVDHAEADRGHPGVPAPPDP